MNSRSHMKMQKFDIFVNINLKINMLKIRNIVKLGTVVYTGEYRGAAHSICNLNYSVPKKIAIVFHNESNYDYHFIIRELVKDFEGQFTCLGENTEKYITFSVSIEKEITRIDKNGKEITKAES